MLGRDIIGFAEVVSQIVKFPLVIIEISRCSAHRHPWKPAMTSRRNPAIFVEGTVSEHFEILNVTWAFGFGIVETVHHADPFDGLLLDTINFDRLRKVGRFKYRR